MSPSPQWKSGMSRRSGIALKQCQHPLFGESGFRGDSRDDGDPGLGMEKPDEGLAAQRGFFSNYYYCGWVCKLVAGQRPTDSYDRLVLL